MPITPQDFAKMEARLASTKRVAHPWKPQTHEAVELKEHFHDRGLNLGPERRQSFVVHGEPVPAPRMTRRDKWLKPRRPCVQRYFDYRDLVQRTVGDVPVVPDKLDIYIYVSMPESWSENKKKAHDQRPHRSKPDRDNYLKAIQDSLFVEDGGVWGGVTEKRWCRLGQERIEITMVFYDPI